jgi:tetrahydromethanopterin S-methyltransferase subunit F
MYFYSNGQDKDGPVTLEDLKQKDLKPKTLIWHEGLDDWKEAQNIEELKEIFELSPPPLNTESDEIIAQKESENLNEEIITRKFSLPLGVKEASQGWIIAGFVFALLGGYFGLIIGFNYAFGNYNKQTKRLGWAMAVIGIFSAAIWKGLN